jgi:cytochrome P450
MVLHPEVQKKAQVEIDTVVGPNRLSDIHDRPSLPYINAIIKESMRWHSVLPLGGSFFPSSRLLRS